LRKSFWFFQKERNIGSLKKSFLLSLRSKEEAVAISALMILRSPQIQQYLAYVHDRGNLSSDDFEITTSFCFRKTARDDIEI